MSTDGYLSEAAVNADPPGGWESGAVADRETAERNAEAIDSPSLTESGLPPNAPDGTDATADAPGGVESDAPGRNADPDLITDDDLDKDDA
ncbi:hypothetical protein SAMN04487846_3040 [Microbacterium sp. cf046]|uniref:hypothetical protein n=1 Tax=Microbacterium sp. cf046 TaxID=1761803 RepID=UPI0008E2885C|nr:hypothetical protein [Microbacterium sp. cf046]SFS15099.1 hypothetical protein SAMN04487846_3040 [Microbacterium sp. cf046]